MVNVSVVSFMIQAVSLTAILDKYTRYYGIAGRREDVGFASTAGCWSGTHAGCQSRHESYSCEHF